MLVDVNLGCPVPKVVSRGSGAALARDISATARVVAAMVDAVDVPVTVKMRLGWDASTINAPELARALQDAGAAGVTVHGRTRCQKYEGTADWSEIARVKEAVGIPVFGSGDVEDVDALARRIESGVVDGVVIARGTVSYTHLDVYKRQAEQGAHGVAAAGAFDGDEAEFVDDASHVFALSLIHIYTWDRLIIPKPFSRSC